MFSLQAVYPPPNEKDIRDIKTKIGDIKTKDGENDQRERFWANLDSVGKEAKEQLLYGADPDHKTVLLYGEALVAAAAAEAENYAASNLTITKSSKESIADNFGVPKDGPEKATAEAAVKRHKDDTAKALERAMEAAADTSHQAAQLFKEAMLAAENSGEQLVEESAGGGAGSRRRDCHFDGTPS